MKSKLFDYIEKDNFVFNLSGMTKLLCFLILTFTVMFSYDARVILAVLIFSFWVLHVSEIQFSQIRVMLYYVLVFIAINFVLTFLFSPQYGVEIYGAKHVWFTITERYTVTAEQMLYQGTKVLKYLSVIPLGMIFLLTTNPSEFAASLSSIGVSYKASFAVALTLRYFPDMIRDYNDLALSQQARGLVLSNKERLGRRLKNMMNIFVPLIFSSLERVETISNAMDLRGFGKHKKRTWYAFKPLEKRDGIAIAICIVIALASLAITLFVNHGRFWNPFTA